MKHTKKLRKLVGIILLIYVLIHVIDLTCRAPFTRFFAYRLHQIEIRTNESSCAGYSKGNGKYVYNAYLTLTNHSDQMKYVTVSLFLPLELIEGTLSSPIGVVINGADEPKVLFLPPGETVVYDNLQCLVQHTASESIKFDRHLPMTWLTEVTEADALRSIAGAPTQEDWIAMCKNPQIIEPLGAIVDDQDAKAKCKRAFIALFGERAYGEVRQLELSATTFGDGSKIWLAEGNAPFPGFGRPNVCIRADTGAIHDVYLRPELI